MHFTRCNNRGIAYQKSRNLATCAWPFGAGTAGVGIADQVRDATAIERGSKKEAAKQIWLIDRPGLPTTGTPLSVAQRGFAKPRDVWADKRPIILGFLASLRTYTPVFWLAPLLCQGLCRRNRKGDGRTHRKAHYSTSLNPTRLHEAVPEDLLKWTNARPLS
jgi:malate dehydrogenase (oxaloacetate-decarboxylating)